LEHARSRPRYFQALAGGHALIRYRTLAHDVRSVTVAIRGGRQTEMRVELEGPLFALWSAEVASKDNTTGSTTIEYTFILEDGKTLVGDPKTYKAEWSEASVFHTPESA